MNQNEINKFRRFALLIGLILITYSLAGVKLVPNNIISPLGIPLNITNPKLLGIGLLLGSIYVVIRYFYYAIITGITPKKARTNLLNYRFPDGSRVSTQKSTSSSWLDPATCEDKLKAEVDKYFPSFSRLNKTEANVFQDREFYRFEIKQHNFSKIFGFLHGCDYWLQIWVNVLAIFIYLIYLIT